MKRPSLFLSLTIGILFCSMLFLSQCTEADDNPNVQHNQQEKEEPELAGYMSDLQYFTHKLALSVEAEDGDAADFYFHEMMEISDEIKEDVPEYEGYQIADLLGAYLDRQTESVDQALSDGEWEQARSRLIELTDACNSCHQATDHGFIQITPGFGNNPYNQTFGAE